MATATTTAALREKLGTTPDARLFQPTAFLGRNGEAVAWVNSKLFGKARGISIANALDLIDHADELLTAVAEALETVEDPATLAALKEAAEAKKNGTTTAAPAAVAEAPKESTADRIARLRTAAK